MMVLRYNTKRILFICSVLSCLVLFLWLRRSNRNRVDPHENYSEKDKYWYKTWHANLKEDTIVILLYTSWFDHLVWSDFDGPRLYEFAQSCSKYKNCLLTYDRSWLKRADAAVFHGRDVEEYRNMFYSAAQLKEVRKQVPKQQLWIYLSHENPKKPSIYEPYDGIFNWTATFDRASDVFVPYGTYVENEKPREITRNFAKEKSRLVAWAASHCGIMRETYVLELQKYIDVTVYGKCRKYFKKQRNCAHNSVSCQRELSTYKFYLAFENDFCNDYVTEKYWERIQQDVVPIVMGANYNEHLVIPGSYIDVSNFDSIQKLAEYLLFLDKNDDEYNKYFAYKTKYKISDLTVYCGVCAAVSQRNSKEFQQTQLSKVYNYERNCRVNKPKMEKLEKQIQESQKVTNDNMVYNWLLWFRRVLSI